MILFTMCYFVCSTIVCTLSIVFQAYETAVLAVASLSPNLPYKVILSPSLYILDELLMELHPFTCFLHG